MAVNLPSKSNQISSSGDYGEMVASTPVDAPAPPPSDGDTWAADPMGETDMCGPPDGSMDHNSGL